MAINPNLILGVQAPQIQAEDPIGRYAKIMALQNGMGQQDLQGLQIKQGQQALAANDRIRALFGGDTAPTDAQILAADPNSNIPKNRLAMQSTQATLDKTKLETQAQQAKIGRDLIASATPDTYADVIAQGKALNQAWANNAPPTLDPKWQQQHVRDATSFLKDIEPKIQAVNAGGTTVMREMNPNAPGYDASPIVHTATPDAIMTDQRTRSEGAANRGNSMEIAKMNDSRTREMNGILADGSLSPEGEQMAQAIAGGQLAPLSGYALNRPGGRALMGRVMQINPQFNGADFGTNQKALRDFGTGKQGNSVRSFNVALSHLDTLDQLSDALNNKDTQAINRIGNFVATQTGAAAPVNFEAAKKIVGDEIVKAIVGGGGGVADREEAARTISAASSPAQLKGVIATYKELMRGQLGGLRQQYEQTTGRQDFDKFLSDSGKAQEHAPAQAAPARPKLGERVDGYIYKGGDPANPKSWDR